MSKKRRRRLHEEGRKTSKTKNNNSNKISSHSLDNHIHPSRSPRCCFPGPCPFYLPQVITHIPFPTPRCCRQYPALLTSALTPMSMSIHTGIAKIFAAMFGVRCIESHQGAFIPTGNPPHRRRNFPIPELNSYAMARKLFLHIINSNDNTLPPGSS